MALSKSVLSLESDNEKKCILCERKITQKDKAHALSNKGWDYLKELAQVWKQINIDIDNKFYFFEIFIIKFLTRQKHLEVFTIVADYLSEQKLRHT